MAPISWVNNGWKYTFDSSKVPALSIVPFNEEKATSMYVGIGDEYGPSGVSVVIPHTQNDNFSFDDLVSARSDNSLKLSSLLTPKNVILAGVLAVGAFMLLGGKDS